MADLSFRFISKETHDSELWGELQKRDSEGEWVLVETGPYEKFVKFIPYLEVTE